MERFLLRGQPNERKWYFFDSKMVGNIMQRIGDSNRIQTFLTGSLLSIVMAIVSVIVYGIIMGGGYNISILTIFLIGSVLYIGWIVLFMKRRRKLDYMRFQEASANQSNIVQLIGDMQNGYIFSDTIANNIGVSDEVPDMDRTRDAVKTANIEEFILSLPLGLNTKIGMEGNGLSTGQKQRIIIARAAYKDAKFLMFDGQHVPVDKLQGSEGHCRSYIF